jgi:hypothetical protein
MSNILVYSSESHLIEAEVGPDLRCGKTLAIL